MAIKHISALVWAPLLAGMQRSCELMEPRAALGNMSPSQLKKETEVLRAGLEFSESVLNALDASFKLAYGASPEETASCIEACMRTCSAYIVLIRTSRLDSDPWFKARLDNIERLINALTKKVTAAQKKADTMRKRPQKQG